MYVCTKVVPPTREEAGGVALVCVHVKEKALPAAAAGVVLRVGNGYVRSLLLHILCPA